MNIRITQSSESFPEENRSNDEPGQSPDDIEHMESLPPSISAGEFWNTPGDYSKHQEDNNEPEHNIGINLEPLVQGHFDSHSVGWGFNIDATTIMVGVVEVTNKEGEEDDEEADGVPEEEGVPGVVVGSHSAVDSATGQHQNIFIERLKDSYLLQHQQAVGIFNGSWGFNVVWGIMYRFLSDIQLKILEWNQFKDQKVIEHARFEHCLGKQLCGFG